MELLWLILFLLVFLIVVNMFPNDFKEEGLNPVKTSPLPSKHEIISCLAVGGRWITAQSDLQVSADSFHAID